MENKKGFCLQLKIFCKNCGESIETFKTLVVNERSAEVNTQTVVVFRETGKGYGSLELFNRCMQAGRMVGEMGDFHARRQWLEGAKI